MKYFAIILVLLCLSSTAQTKLIPVRTERVGKITVLKVKGQYTDASGNFKWNGKPPYWYSLTAKKFIVQENEVLIHRYITIWKKSK